MYHRGFEKLLENASSPEALERTVDYLEGHLCQFLKKNDRAFLCFPAESPDSLGAILDRVIRRVGGIPVHWGPDYRWKSLLRQLFVCRASVLIGPPLVILGLTKLSKYTGTPLSVRHVMTAGYPCLDWMIDGITRGLDCRTWSCFGPGAGAVVSGFSCGKSRGVHIRDDAYSFQILDGEDRPLPAGSVGDLVLWPRESPQLRCRVSEHARLDFTPCNCGCTSPRLMDNGAGRDVDMTLENLGERLMYWSSILDCELKQGESGLEMELVVFPGEKLPKLPTCARQIIRPWDPEKDMPSLPMPGWIKSYFYRESH